MTTARSLERRGGFTLACVVLLIIVALTREGAMQRSAKTVPAGVA